MTSKAGAKRPRPRASPVHSTPESPTMLSSMQRLLDIQTEQINDRIKDRIKELEQRIDQKLSELITSISFNAGNIERIQKEEIPSMQRMIEEDRQNAYEELDRVNVYICRENLEFGIPLCWLS